MDIRNIIIHSVKGDLYQIVKNGRKIWTKDHLHATLVYSDGTIEKVSFEEGLEAAVKYGLNNKMTERDMFNNGIIHYVREDKYNETLSNVVDDINKNDEKLSFFSRLKEKVNAKLKNNKAVKKFKYIAAAGGLAAVLGIGGCAIAKSASRNNAKAAVADEANKNKDTKVNIKPSITPTPSLKAEKKEFSEMTFAELIKATTNETQKEAMNRRFNVINYLNGEFADFYLEEGKDIRFGLYYDELEALDLAYNNYTDEEIAAIYNGSKLDARELENAYKSGTLMMMGAYTMSNSDMPVKGYNLIKDEAKRAEYKTWEDRFYAIKEATGQDKIDLIKKWYKDVNALFPITEEERTVGIAHHDSRAKIDYGLLASLTPMFASGEQIWQNYEIDETYNDQAIAFINDLGVCNYTQDKYERYSNKVDCCCDCKNDDEKTYPTADDFKRAMNDELRRKNIIVIDDAHRDISKYDSFQDAVNWHFEYDENGNYSGKVIVKESTHTEKKTWTKTDTKTTTKKETTKKKVTREEAVKKFGEEKVKAKEQEVQKKIEKENAEAKAKAEKEAAQKQKEIQKKYDEEKKQIDKEVAEENAKKEKEIIDNLPDYVDKGSVSTDPGTGTNDLPNPNESGKRLDNNEPAYNGADKVTENHVMNVEPKQNNNTNTAKPATTPAPKQESAPVVTPEPLPNPQETGKDFDAKADKIVEEMANNPTATDEGIQKTK